MDRAEFDFTIDDLADVSFRNFLGLRDFLSLVGIAITAAVIAVFVTAYQAPHYGARVKRRMANALAEQLGSSPMHCEVELRPEHLWSRQGNIELRCAWKDATAIAEIPEGVELRFRDGYVLVRSRAFANDTERAAFTARARDLAGLPS